MKPQRIQLRRTKGWKMPPNTRVVTRATKFGNPFVVRAASQQIGYYACSTAKEAVACFKERMRGIKRGGGWLLTNPARGWEISIADIVRELRGKNLACWCPLDQPCHADVLLELANAPTLSAGLNQSATHRHRPATPSRAADGPAEGAALASPVGEAAAE